MSGRYIIVDDEHIAHSIIKNYCDMLPSMEFAKSCYDAIEAIEYLNDNKVDLIFLDLNMPKLKGFQFLRTLSNPPKVIVTTAYKEFALEGYELNIVDYLLKPFSFERFLASVNRALSETKSIPAPLIEEPEAPSKSTRRVFFYSNKKYYQVQIDDILYVEASGNYSKIILLDDVIKLREKLSDVVSRLPSNEFQQVHRSFVVAVKHIKRVEGGQIFIGESVVPIGRIYKNGLENLLK